jgi:hypothetical protein
VNRLIFVSNADDALPAASGDVTVVLDAAWTPSRHDRPNIVSIRPALASAVESTDLYAAALGILDDWAAASSVADHVLVEGVTFWYRVREDLWHWVHERLIWLYAMRALDASHGVRAVSVPADERALIDVVNALGRPIDVRAGPPDGEQAAASDAGTPRSRSAQAGRFPLANIRRILKSATQPTAPPPTRGRSDRDQRATELARRAAFLDHRLERLMAGSAPRIAVLTLPSSHQRIGARESSGRRDPNLSSVIPALEEARLAPVVIGLGLSRQREEDWAITETDDLMLPAFYLQSRWARAEDRDGARSATDSALAGLDSLDDVPFDLHGLDLDRPFHEVLRATVERLAEPDALQIARIERFIDEVRPAALLTTHEGHRLPWLLAAQRAGVPSFALQHGVLYPGHAGYPNHRHERLVLPTRTFVFGDHERRVLVGLAYGPDEVAVAGSPRLDLDAAAATADTLTERSDVRRELGVADGTRMLVISTQHIPFVRRAHIVHMLETCLGGPLPGIHLVVKQHPGERDEGPYRQLLVGLADAGGYEPPPITIVKDMDLYRLLRAADAHISLNSTVLTDAVMAGTCNLIAIVEGHRDLLGYVDAGVARPVHGVADVRTAMQDPRPADPAARRAFLDDHFLPGDAGGRIAAAIAATVDVRTKVGAARPG